MLNDVGNFKDNTCSTRINKEKSLKSSFRSSLNSPKFCWTNKGAENCSAMLYTCIVRPDKRDWAVLREKPMLILYQTFISLLYLDLYVLGDDALIS